MVKVKCVRCHRPVKNSGHKQVLINKSAGRFKSFYDSCRTRKSQANTVDLFTRMSALITLQSKTVWNIKNVRNVLLQYVALMEQGINKSERNELYIFIMIMILANQRLILE